MSTEQASNVMTDEEHAPLRAEGDNWVLHHADCVDVLRALPESSVHLTITSPPYLGLYVYQASPRDLGNSRTDADFWVHFKFIIDELFRVTRRGRLVVIDCMNVPAMKERDGYIGLKDFRGDIIREFRARGFIYSSEHCIRRDPLLEATRTKALGLMHKQLCKDSTMSRAGLAQYLLGFRKPGANENPVAHPNGLETFFGLEPPAHGNLSHERWRRYADPIWTDIDFTRTLNATAAREGDDERHACPMALDLIERAVELWSAPGEVVFDPFTGVGSTGYVALQRGRRFVGSELKASYAVQAAKNLREAATVRQSSLFAEAT